MLGVHCQGPVMLKCLVILLTLLSLAASSLCAQRSGAPLDQDTWLVRIDSVLDDASLRYAEVLDAFRPIRSSDTLMHALRRRARSRKHKSAEAFALTSLSVIERNASRYERAMRLTDTARLLAEGWRDTLAQVVALNSKGVVLRRADRIIEALDVHQAALELAGAVRNPDFGTLRAIAISHNSKGQIHRTLDQYKLAKAAFRQSMEVEQRNDNTFGLAINHANLGSILTKQDSLSAALDAYRRALSYNEQLNSAFGIAICQLGIAEIAVKQGDAQRALTLAQQALPEAEKRGDAKYIAVARQAIGDAQLALGRLNRAEDELQEAYRLATEKTLPEQQIRALHSLVRLEAARGNSDLAYQRLQEAYAAERALLSAQTRRYVAAVDASYRAQQREAQIAELAEANRRTEEASQRRTRFLIAVIVALALLAILLGALYRQRKLRLQRDVARLEQQRMASQMNPHFIFNGLNSIKSHLISSEEQQAVALLGDYSAFMRRILNSSIDQSVSLAEELDNCRLYVSIENSRYSGEIDFDVQVAEEVSTDRATLPPLVLQPFLENAIHHGLRAKEGKKRLSLLVEQASGKLQGDRPPLQITITDNGIGRAAAARQAKTLKRQRKSVGIDITRRRLAYFAQRLGGRADIVFEDLTDEQGEPAGTKVIVTL